MVWGGGEVRIRSWEKVPRTRRGEGWAGVEGQGTGNGVLLLSCEHSPSWGVLSQSGVGLVGYRWRYNLPC